MVVIGVTGISSTLGRTVVPRLLQEANVTRIIGVDVRPPPDFGSPKVAFHHVDVRDGAKLAKVFKGIDALVHLAFVVIENIPDKRTIYAVNVEGSKNAFEAAAAGGARKIVHLSSVAAYGMLPATPPNITEETPLQGKQNANFYYPHTKAIVEEFLDEFERVNRAITVTRFRPHIIAGPQFASQTTNLEIVLGPLRRGGTFWDFRPLNADRPMLQLTHEEDIAEAVAMAISHELAGAYNLTSNPLDMEDFLAQRGMRIRYIPWGLADFGLALGSLLSRRIRQLKAWATGLKYQIIVKNEKIQAAGFRFMHPTTEECIEEALRITQGAGE